jgi:hypothetical protein
LSDVISQPGGETGADRDLPEATQEEQDAVKLWLQRVDRAERNEERRTWAEKLPDWRKRVYGTQHEDKSGEAMVRTNMIFASIAAIMPRVYAKNPEIACKPTDAVPGNRMGVVKKFAATAEKVLRSLLVREGKLKKRAKHNVRAASTTGYGILKLGYQKEYRGDAVMVRRMQDTQDNLATIEARLLELKKEDDPIQLSRQRDELKSNLAAVASGNEVKIFKGFVVDCVRSEDFLVLDDSITSFDEYAEAGALGQLIWITAGTFKKYFKYDPRGTCTLYNMIGAKDAGAATEGQQSQDMFVCVVEIWDRENGVVRTTAKGSKRWCRQPYAPKYTSQRWYPFFALGFNLVEGRWRPISDVELLQGLQNEYNTTRTNYADVREKSVPVRVFRKAGNMKEEDIEALMNSRNKDWIGVEGNPGKPIADDVMQLDGLRIDPAAYDVSQIRNDMDLVMGLSDASRANLIKPKTATEAEIMQEALTERMGERRDTNEDLISEMGEAALEISLRDFSKDEIKAIAGDEAEWPEQASVDEIFSLVQVSVRAGSTGKPNAQQDREQWGKLMPIVSEAMEKVATLRLNGQFDMAEATVALLRETLKRFEENLDVDALIPPVKKDENGQPIAQVQAMQENQQMKQELEEVKKALEECQQALQKAQAGEQSRVAKIEADKAIALAQEQSKRDLAAQEHERAQRDAAIKADEERAAEEAKRHQRELDADTQRLAEQAELERRDRLERDQMSREDRLAEKKIEAEQATKIRVAEINAGAKQAAAEVGAEAKTEAAEVGADAKVKTAKAGEKGEAAPKSELGQLLSEFKDFMEADRVPEYDEKGMMTRVRVVPKKKPAKATP